MFERSSVVDEDETNSYLPESSTITVTNLASDNNNKIDSSSTGSPDSDSSRFDSAEENERSESRSNEGATPSSMTPSSGEETNGNNQIDSLEASESDGKHAEQVIVFTMKPESQIGEFEGRSGSIGTFGTTSSLLVELTGHVMRLGLLLGWTRWFQG